ncbi:unnamed protein product [Gongylonema pulchrum]|uniref:Cell division cycle associated 7 n=1 Tax=Gongylonema pulchrum TaxID=637853 RepID=A0A183ERS1_9BILA|nr:unnamed protein product [Gongylonema pulchrum]
MPKRVEINEEFLADMIEQAQPKPSPSKRRDGDAGRNFSRATTAKVRSGASSTKTTSAVADDDDFLLQSIASVLPQSSSSRRTRSSGLGTPPKKARAMTGEAAGTSNGPKRVPPRAVLPNAHNPPSPHSCSVIRTKDSLRAAGISLKKSSKCAINNSSSSALFNAALQSSALESDTLSEDNYSPLTENAMVVDKNVPRDVDEEFQAEQLIIDCSVVSDTVKQTAVRPVQKLRSLFMLFLLHNCYTKRILLRGYLCVCMCMCVCVCARCFLSATFNSGTTKRGCSLSKWVLTSSSPARG